MKDLLFTQECGFVDYEVPERLVCGDDEDWDDYTKRLELRKTDQDQLMCQDHLEMFSCSEYSPGSAEIYFIPTTTKDEPRYFVLANAMSAEGSGWETIWVKTRGDLFALRIKLAQLLQVDTASALGDLRILVRRLLTAFHGHDADRVCSGCDPRENRARQNEAKRQRALEAKKRVFFALNREEGLVFIRHAKTDEEVEETFNKLRFERRLPKLVLALSQQGTFQDWMELQKRFKPHMVEARGSLFAAASELLAYINQARKRQGKAEVCLLSPTSAN